MFNTSVVRGTKGVVVGRGINKRQVERGTELELVGLLVSKSK
jgi:hypothetical protein